jgi:uncharacterized protein
MGLATEMPTKSSTSTRGFASMDREQQRVIARKGGESVPNEKRSFAQNRGLAAEAGRKGGQSVNPAKRSFSRNHAAGPHGCVTSRPARCTVNIPFAGPNVAFRGTQRKAACRPHTYPRRLLDVSTL